MDFKTLSLTLVALHPAKACCLVACTWTLTPT